MKIRWHIGEDGQQMELLVNQATFKQVNIKSAEKGEIIYIGEPSYVTCLDGVHAIYAKSKPPATDEGRIVWQKESTK